ncbi:MAG TPA: four helix bundle protein [Patescibacteria group bacterium]|nr:four helix bundle protein [Patescibacteria group bacterium]
MSQFVYEKFGFERLNVYQESIKIVNLTYQISKKFPKEEMFGLTNQLRRASTSIALNIAEGSARTKKDFAHFLSLAKGSCFECVAIIDICKQQNLISESEFSIIYEQLNKISRMISKFQASLRNTKNE